MATNQEPIVISTENTGTLSMVIDGNEVKIPFCSTDMNGYRKAVEAFRNFDDIKKRLESNAKDKKSSGPQKGANALELVANMMDEFMVLVRFAIGDEAWDRHFKKITKDISISAWEALAVQVINAYMQYIDGATSTDGKI
jgi:hypothetical protein